VTKFNPTGAALVYSTYLCGSAGGLGAGIAVDRSGNAYVTGHTSSTDFPTTPGAFQTACDVVSSGCSDAFVTEINPAGSALIYSTFLGGSGDDSGSSIALDSAGEAYVTGITSSAIAHVPDDFPTTPSAFQTTCTTNAFPCGFVTKLNSTGTALLYSTYLESATAKTITVDSSGNAYITGNTFGGLPTTSGAFQTNFSGAEDAFVTKFNATGTALAYSTYLAGNIQTIGDGITVDSSGNAYITGATYAGFPTTPGAFQTTCNNPSVPECTATFVTKINPAGSALVYSTLLGGGGNDGGSSIAVDSSGNTYITGQATSTTFPTTSGAFQTTCSGGSGCSQYGDAFVTEVNPTGSGLIYSTYLGGSSGDAGSGLAVDNSHNVYVTGWTSSADFPTTPGVFQSASKGGADAFVTKIDLSMAGQDFSMAASGSSTATVSPGQIADYTIALTPAGGFAQPVALSCTGAPAQSTCSVPSSVSLDGSSPSEVKIAVTTAGETSANMALPASLPPSGRAVTWLMACGLPELVIFGTVGTQWRNRHRRLIYGLALLCLAALGTTRSACSSNTSPGGGGGTPQGSYKLTVTGKFTSSSTTLTHNTTLTLIVQ
jgi:Beta-propeller repeat